MLRGLYTAATGMIHQSRRLDAVSNNIANANTTGYKKDRVVNRAFEEELLLRMGKDETPIKNAIGFYRHGVYVDRVLINYDQGSLEQTGREQDIALRGSGFFTVQTDNGLAYTRDGNFTLDPNGYLMTTEGHQVLGENGPIRIQGQGFVVDGAGNVFSSGTYTNANGVVTAGDVYVDRLRLTDFENPQALEKLRNNLYASPDGNGLIPFEGEVMQGYLESSNVDVLNEMVDMITASRNYETNQRIVRMMDETLGKTVNEVGRV